MFIADDLIDVVTCAECGGVSVDIALTVCPSDGAVLGERRMTPGEFFAGRPFGSL